VTERLAGPGFVEGAQVADARGDGEGANGAELGGREDAGAEVEDVWVGAVAVEVEGDRGEGEEVGFGVDLLACLQEGEGRSWSGRRGVSWRIAMVWVEG
jgi:hypothetical protein